MLSHVAARFTVDVELKASRMVESHLAQPKMGGNWWPWCFHKCSDNKYILIWTIVHFHFSVY